MSAEAELQQAQAENQRLRDKLRVMHRRVQRAEGELQRITRWGRMVDKAAQEAGPAYMLHRAVGSPERMDAHGNPTPARRALYLVVCMRFLAMSRDWRGSAK